LSVVADLIQRKSTRFR